MTSVTARYLHLVRHGEAASEDGGLTERGREQARCVGRRLARLPVAAVHHGPLERAVRTAQEIAASLPGVPVAVSAAAGDYVPPVGDPDALPEVFARFLAGATPADLAEGAALAADALAAFAGPVGPVGQPDPGDPADRVGPRQGGPGGPDVRHDVVVTHGFCVGWFVRHALDAPEPRWLGLNAANCALTTIVYRAGRPPSLVVFNDQSHLPEDLRWTGFPPELRI